MNIKNINGALFAMALVAAGAGFTSCEDEPDKYEVTGGTPTIDYVRPVDAASKDSLLTAASLNNTICIVGRNPEKCDPNQLQRPACSPEHQLHDGQHHHRNRAKGYP